MTEYEKDSTKRSVWLVIDVPGMAAPRIPELEQAMQDFAREWIQGDQTWHSDPYHSEIGVAESKKLRMFVQER